MEAIEKLPIVSVTPFTLQDFPGKVACILWFTGCNMKCPYCHNPDLARGRGRRLEWERLERFLRQRAGLLEGVVLSGGECCLYPGTIDFAVWLRGLGYRVKVDTNGSRPAVLETLLERGSVDYVAMDFKAPLSRYAELTSWQEVAAWERSLGLLIRSGVDCEIRTTVHRDLLSEEEVSTMAAYLAAKGFRGRYCLQGFQEAETLGGLRPSRKPFDASLVDWPKGLRWSCRNLRAPKKGYPSASALSPSAPTGGN